MTPDKIKVAAIKTVLPGFSKSFFSMAYRPDKYGMRFALKIIRFLRSRFPGEPIPGEPERSSSARKYEIYVRCGMSKIEQQELLAALKEDGFADMQSGLAWLFREYKARRKYVKIAEG